MTESKEAAATSLWDIGTELEHIHVQFYQIQNLLFIFDEQLERDLDFLKQCNNGPVQHFLRRYDVLRSVMEIMQLHIVGAIDALQVQINAIQETDRNTRSQSTK